MNTGIKVSLKGKGITSNNPEEIAFSSNKEIIKLRGEEIGSTTYTFASQPAFGSTIELAKIPHSNGYIPFAIVYMKEEPDDPENSLSRYNVLDNQLVSIDFEAGAAEGFDWYIDKNNLTIEFFVSGDSDPGFNNMAGRTFYFKWYIFTQRADF